MNETWQLSECSWELYLFKHEAYTKTIAIWLFGCQIVPEFLAIDNYLIYLSFIQPVCYVYKVQFNTMTSLGLRPQKYWFDISLHIKQNIVMKKHHRQTHANQGFADRSQPLNKVVIIINRLWTFSYKFSGIQQEFIYCLLTYVSFVLLATKTTNISNRLRQGFLVSSRSKRITASRASYHSFGSLIFFSSDSTIRSISTDLGPTEA